MATNTKLAIYLHATLGEHPRFCLQRFQDPKTGIGIRRNSGPLLQTSYLKLNAST